QTDQIVTPRLDYHHLVLSGSGVKTFSGNTAASFAIDSAENASAIVSSGVTITSPAIHVEPTTSFTFSNNASLIQSFDQNFNIGEITVQRNAFVNRLDYVYWSSPVAAQNLREFSEETTLGRFYQLEETTNSFSSIDPITNDFVAAQGYMVRAPNTYLDYPAAKQ